MKKIYFNCILIVLSFLICGCNNNSDDRIIPQEVIIMNSLEYETFYECKGFFTEDVGNISAVGSSVIKSGNISKGEIISIGYVIASASHGFAIEELSFYKDSNKKECIYTTNIFAPLRIITSINKQGLIIDEELINTVSIK